MKKRYIVTPKDKRAEELLDLNNAPENDLIELVLTDEQFEKLTVFGVFSGLNDIVGTSIDDFEDECIKSSEKLRIGLKYFKAIPLEDETMVNIKEKIVSIFEEALSRKTGVYFFF